MADSKKRIQDLMQILKNDIEFAESNYGKPQELQENWDVLKYTTDNIYKLCAGETPINAPATLPIFDVSNSYCGEDGDDNIKAEIKEMIHACGGEKDFMDLYLEVKDELIEAAFDLDQESKVSNL